ncbi:hypothetical protein SUGI_0274860 [Cryptomeria japonica]|nr:hypothetical protein SUGI_0274860 [Cryptomeria japonica]
MNSRDLECEEGSGVRHALIQVESCCMALPRSGEELSCGLKWRATREAGFTEQRQPPFPYSGRITNRLSLGPQPFYPPNPFQPCSF